MKQTVSAFLIAPLPPIFLLAVIFAMLEYMTGGFSGVFPFIAATLMFGLLGSYLGIGLFGVPLFLILKKANLLRRLSAILGGALIPVLVFVVAPEVERLLTLSPYGGASFSSGGCDRIIDDVRTACGYWSLAQSAAWIGFLGGLGGLTAWRVYSGGFRARLLAPDP